MEQIAEMNDQRNFDALTINFLKTYVYILRDPRDSKVFYVGQGTGNRVFDHLNEASLALRNNFSLFKISSKILRIIDISKNGQEVEFVIIAHALSKENSDFVEAAIYDVLAESQNGETLNNITPPRSSRLSADDLLGISAPNINPAVSFKSVFIFNIKNGYLGGGSTYNAARSIWPVNDRNTLLKPSFAVGLIDSISKGSFEIDRWVPILGTGKSEFISPGHPSPLEFEPLLNKNWNRIVSIAKGFWQRGGYLIVEFDGNGKFKLLRGSQDGLWHSC